MKYKFYAYINEYAKEGWYLHNCLADASWYEDTRTDEYIYLCTVDIDAPSKEQLAKKGAIKVEQMKKDLVVANAEAEAKIKEFESKFLLLTNG